MLAVSLARQSQSRDEDESLSLAFQHRRCQEEAERRGDEIAGTFDDIDVPGDIGHRSKRIGLHAMMANLKTRPDIRRVYVYNISRLARDTLYTLELVRDLSDLKPSVELCSTSENIEDPTILAIIAAMASRERITLSNNVAYAVREAARRGKMILHPPYGYHRIDGVVVPDPQRAPVVRRIYAEYVAGKTVREIVEGLNADGIPSAEGMGWRTTTITRLLGKHAYTGRISISASRDPAGRERPALISEGRHDPLVDRETWEAAQRRKTAPVRKLTQYPAPWLSGIAYCESCGSRLYLEVQRQKKIQPYWVFRCASHRRAQVAAEANRCTGQPLASYRPFDAMARAALASDLSGISTPSDALRLAQEATGYTNANRANELRLLIIDIDDRLERIHDDRESGDLSIERFRIRKTTLEHDRAAAETELAATPPSPELAVIAAAHQVAHDAATGILAADDDALRGLIAAIGATVSLDLRHKRAEWTYAEPYGWLVLPRMR